VRLCDGRYFPLPRDGAANSADLCNSFCPASKTKVFTGGEIDNAVAPDGSRYGGLANAFAYRARVVADCTCNGKDAFGLARLDVKNDPTLQPGDVVATAKGLLAYNGGSAKKSERNFTPVGSYAGLGRDLRKALANLKVSPDTMAADTATKATSGGAGAKASDGKRRAQLDR
jgi:hypothetical protein